MPIAFPLLFSALFYAEFARPRSRMSKIRPFSARKNLFFYPLLCVRLIPTLEFFIEQHACFSLRCSPSQQELQHKDEPLPHKNARNTTYTPAFHIFSILAQESLSGRVRLKTRLPGASRDQRGSSRRARTGSDLQASRWRRRLLPSSIETGTAGGENLALAMNACNAYNICMQYTIRNVPDYLDAALRVSAREQGKSLNEVAIETLARGFGLGAGPCPPARSERYCRKLEKRSRL